MSSPLAGSFCLFGFASDGGDGATGVPSAKIAVARDLHVLRAREEQTPCQPRFVDNLRKVTKIVTSGSITRVADLRFADREYKR
jgi:hypothetical protein